MKKLISISIFIITLIVLPLIGNISLLISWPILFLGVFISILLATQPVMDPSESKRNRSTDNGTMWLILIVSSCGQVVSILDWAYVKDAPMSLSSIQVSGIFFMTFGLLLRLWAINTLKTAFSATVQIKEDQKLITSGPYQWFRHPSYTGAWLLMVGDALLLHSLVGLYLLGLVMLWAYSERIKAEEKLLAKTFGADFVKHERNTWKMLPGW